MFRKLDLSTTDEVKKVFSVISQLRKHLDLETYQRLIHTMQNEGYELWVYEEGNEILGAMGLRPYSDFVRGTHLYIDDLVVDEKYRSQKIGAKLLDHAEKLAKERVITSLRLACALENVGGIKFYEKEAWTKRSYSYVKKIL